MSILDTHHSINTDDLLVENGIEEAVRVFVRIRPLNKRELLEKQTIGWNFNETSMLEDTQNGQRVYAYDHCFGPTSTNQETYDIVGRPVVLKAMEGYNGTVFTYGQTGSGKTWTMRGCDSDPGMMILCIRDIMEWVETHPQFLYTLRVSYLEVYNEEINDLLGAPGPNSKNLRIVSEDAAKGAVIGGLIEEIVRSPPEFMAILQRGEASRSYAATNMNAESSRSHTIYRVSIEALDRELFDETEEIPSTTGGAVGFHPNSRVSYLNLVDLAGSERQKSTNASGKVLKEGANINRSLLALGAVINKLGELSKKQKKGAKEIFIPYRDSKLTRILKQSLGGNTLTSVLCAVTPAPMHREETVSTLKFGQLCKSIKNTVKGNDGIMDDKALIKQYRNTISELRSQLESFLGGGKMVGGTSMDGVLVSRGDLGKEMGFDLGQKSSDETENLSEKMSEQQRLIVSLKRELEEFQDLEQSKAEFEEHEMNKRQELEEEREKLDKEKQMIQAERRKLLKDRSNMDEKETKILQLFTNLDERDSKLRQTLGTMREQEEQWKRSVTDLQRREDLVNEWQTNHHKKEKNLQDIGMMQEKKFAELNQREKELAELEVQFRLQQLDMLEREQKLQLGQNRVLNAEASMVAMEERIQAQEAILRKREADADLRDRELASRRKEMESWNELLREKDRKVGVDQRTLDEREESLRSNEERTKSKEEETDRRVAELRQKESELTEQVEKYKGLMKVLESRDVELQEKVKRTTKVLDDLNSRDEELSEWEKRLEKLQQRMSGIEEMEEDLKKRIHHQKHVEDDFFNVKVAQITSRHLKELSHLQGIVSEQLKIAADFQKELEDVRLQLSIKSKDLDESQVSLQEKDEMIELLRNQLAEQQQSFAANHSNSRRTSIHAVDDHYRLSNRGNNGTMDHPSVNYHGSSESKGLRSDGTVFMNDFYQQLMETERVLYKVLKQNNALPKESNAFNETGGMDFQKFGGLGIGHGLGLTPAHLLNYRNRPSNPSMNATHQPYPSSPQSSNRSETRFNTFHTIEDAATVTTERPTHLMDGPPHEILDYRHSRSGHFTDNEPIQLDQPPPSLLTNLFRRSSDPIVPKLAKSADGFYAAVPNPMSESGVEPNQGTTVHGVTASEARRGSLQFMRSESSPPGTRFEEKDIQPVPVKSVPNHQSFSTLNSARGPIVQSKTRLPSPPTSTTNHLVRAVPTRTRDMSPPFNNPASNLKITSNFGPENLSPRLDTSPDQLNPLSYSRMETSEGSSGLQIKTFEKVSPSTQRLVGGSSSNPTKRGIYTSSTVKATYSQSPADNALDNLYTYRKSVEPKKTTHRVGLKPKEKEDSVAVSVDPRVSRARSPGDSVSSVSTMTKGNTGRNRSPFTSPDISTIPIQNIFKTEIKNGIPVTTVNLASSAVRKVTNDYLRTMSQSSSTKTPPFPPSPVMEGNSNSSEGKKKKSLSSAKNNSVSNLSRGPFHYPLNETDN